MCTSLKNYKQLFKMYFKVQFYLSLLNFHESKLKSTFKWTFIKIQFPVAVKSAPVAQW